MNKLDDYRKQKKFEYLEKKLQENKQIFGEKWNK